ncbi:hypothetical protein NEUTE1DRAFT_103695 [Neurospora tetrasperma FGSC 2508]|uniref:Uncharacterized protein n=1 Tax=Neurospora tetrasperma (strain FGSC 2508 / ATCC MYA-4615 / P0657) TaxID=510951 RepID=F8MWW4_NEUT8|nr:uncharacterized protein NEUTE1DRAFT_103695 [Neurospora tetrasperma FGSC 2508]EGO54235.1 hypothetical protein NEUTE1DRAFT_103695 [Neurospora tetrasperma FGSC 2508]EGZ68332.1 hypothetical protein NEUTE2DRAFT_132988 [Neurospora tetrasperma FGSC 2509]
MDNHHSSSAPSSKRSSTLSPPVKKALTLKEQRVLYAAKAEVAGKGDAEPAFRTVQVPITSVTSKHLNRRAPKPTTKSPKTAPAGYGPKVVMKENLRPSSKFATKTSTEPSPKSGSTISPPVNKKALTLKEQRALYAAKQKVVTQITRRVSSRTGSEPLSKRSVNRNYSTSPTASALASASSVGSPTSPPVAKRALTLKEQMALYAARGKVTAPVLREVQSNVDVGSPTELAVRRYYSSSSTSTKASSSASMSPKTDLNESSVISRTSASSCSRTATKNSASSSSRGSSRTSKPPICPQSTIRKALAKFEREEEAEAALQISPRKKTTSTPVPKTSGGYTLKEQMKFAAAKRAAVKKADVEGSAKTSFTEGPSDSGKKRSRDEASLDNRKDDGSGRQTESLSRGKKRAKWC